MTQKTKAADAAPADTQVVDNTEAAPAPAKKVKTETVKIAEGLKQVNYI